MIQAFHVSKRYPRNDIPALRDVSLEIGKGEFVFLTGPSGAGKSTLLRLILGAERPTHGQLMVFGQNLNRMGERELCQLRRTCGVVFQDFKLLASRTVEDNVAIALEIQGVGGNALQSRVFEMLKRVGLAHKLRQLPERLSGGEQQRVAIARALINEPRIVLADEPTGSLDRDRADEIMEYLYEANAQGTTVVVATHDEHLLSQTNRRVIHLDEGRLATP